MSGRCLQSVLESVSEVPRECLGSASRVSRKCLESVLEVSRKCLRGVPPHPLDSSRVGEVKRVQRPHRRQLQHHLANAWSDILSHNMIRPPRRQLQRHPRRRLRAAPPAAPPAAPSRPRCRTCAKEDERGVDGTGLLMPSPEHRVSYGGSTHSEYSCKAVGYERPIAVALECEDLCHAASMRPDRLRRGREAERSTSTPTS